MGCCAVCAKVAALWAAVGAWGVMTLCQAPGAYAPARIVGRVVGAWKFAVGGMI